MKSVSLALLLWTLQQNVPLRVSALSFVETQAWSLLVLPMSKSSKAGFGGDPPDASVSPSPGRLSA